MKKNSTQRQKIINSLIEHKLKTFFENNRNYNDDNIQLLEEEFNKQLDEECKIIENKIDVEKIDNYIKKHDLISDKEQDHVFFIKKNNMYTKTFFKTIVKTHILLKDFDNTHKLYKVYIDKKFKNH